jgi:hypothetical protein
MKYVKFQKIIDIFVAGIKYTNVLNIKIFNLNTETMNTMTFLIKTIVMTTTADIDPACDKTSTIELQMPSHKNASNTVSNMSIRRFNFLNLFMSSLYQELQLSVIRLTAVTLTKQFRFKH